jgi:hypothetical protein
MCVCVCVCVCVYINTLWYKSTRVLRPIYAVWAVRMHVPDSGLAVATHRKEEAYAEQHRSHKELTDRLSHTTLTLMHVYILVY